MIIVSPHKYRQEARSRGLPDAVIDNALTQALPPERNNAPAILTLKHLAHRIDEKYTYLRSLIASQGGEHYREFRISKRSGGGRRIAVPEHRLMAIQRWIVREILKRQPVHSSSYAYAPHSSILKCAEQHAGAGWLLKLDIHDFFESIPERSVYRVFREIGYQPLVSFELARLCTRPWLNPPANKTNERSVPNSQTRGVDTYRRRLTGYLPQGAPTSPMLSNLVCKRLDLALTDLARSEGLVFTRYSDDLTFSGPSNTFRRAKAEALVNRVRDILAQHRFRLHERKISIVPPGGRKVVLGLLVDRAMPRLPPDLRSRIADHVRGIEKFGIARHAETRGFDATTGMIHHIGGLIRFAQYIEPAFADPLRTRFEAALAKEKWSLTT